LSTVERGIFPLHLLEGDVRRSFENEIRRGFQDLIADGRLTVVESRVDAQAFGNALVTMSGPGFNVRLVEGRGDVYGEVARAHGPDSWYPLQYVLAAISHLNPAEGSFSVPGFSEGVRDLWSVVSELGR
jgi:hypothetical protein